MRLLVTGASGLLGLNLSLLAHNSGYDVTGLVHSHPLPGAPFEVRGVDLLDPKNTTKVIEDSQPDGIIHCAAVADISEAQKNPDLTNRINVDASGKIAEAAYGWGIPLIHISTDAVFDGKEGGYIETDPTNPLSVYAQSKLAAESVVTDLNSDALVARVVFYGWSRSGKRSLSEFFYNNLKEGLSVNGFTDTIFCPLYVEDLSEILLEILAKRLNGLYHVVSPEPISKFDFGMKIANRFGFDPGLIKPIKMADIKREAPRALNLSLKAGKVQNALGRELPSIEEGIDHLYRRWEEGYHLQLRNIADKKTS